MKKVIFKRAVCIALVLVFAVPAVVFSENGNGVRTEDALIQTDPVDNTYTGRPQASTLIQQLQFTDLLPGSENSDAIIRSGALEIIRPTTGQFRPTTPVTNEEAITYAVRLQGLSEDARARSVAIAADLPDGVPLNTIWSLGYLESASVAELIPVEWFEEAVAEVAAQFADATEESAEPTVAAPVFRRTEPAARQFIARLLADTLYEINSDIVDVPVVGLPIQSFTDWQSVSAEAVFGANILLNNNIMRGQTATTFGPNSAVSNLEMAQIIRNFDKFHYEALGLERRMGVVSDITNEQRAETGEWTIWRHIHVRRADGNVDMLQLSQTGSASPQDGVSDAVVLREGFVMGLGGLEISDRIEYLVHPETGTVWYVFVTSQVVTRTERLRLELIDMDNGTMTFRNDAYVVFTYPMSNGLYGTGPDGVPFIRMPGNQLFPAAGLPRGSFYNITLVGSVITKIEFVGDEVKIPEHRGIVVINDPDFGYLTILDSNRNEQDFTYNPAQLLVHRRQYYDSRDTIGGMHEMFPSLHTDPRTADISNVTVGDIVVFRVAEDDPYRIIEIFAVENTTTRYGKIMQIIDHGGSFDILMEFENGRTAWHRFVQGILVTSGGVPSNPNVIQPGDWARITVNQHLVAPGVMDESIREIAIDGGGHHITNVISGNLAGFNAAQNSMQIQQAMQLTPSGWSNHSPLVSYNIGGPNVRYFHNGSPVTLAHINRYLVRDPNAVVYMALENHFAGERAVHVNILGGNRLTRYGTILSSANNQFNMLEVPGMMQTNSGTIVVRNGRLVGPEQIMASDWARVSLVGPTASVVDIQPAPATDGVQIIRGRITRVMPFEGFVAEAISIFDGFRWNYTPIARDFTIDHNTLFINDSGLTSIEDFIGYTDNSVINNVYNVVVEGGRAARVIQAPHTEPNPQTAGASGHLTVRGTIYAVNSDTVSLRDMTVYNARTGAWERFSNVNATGSVTVKTNTIIVNRNEVVPASGLQVGQQIMAFSNVRRSEVDIAPGLSADVYIVLVEN
ncbi:MAG: hypothetical protein FWE27_05300 [Defluviitaleaceae bacterium]|nr:hypothetical protein [Defluviitaleaceae bacterium]